MGRSCFSGFCVEDKNCSFLLNIYIYKFIIVLSLVTSFGPACVAIIRSLHKDTKTYSNSLEHQVGDLPHFTLKYIISYVKYMWVCVCGIITTGVRIFVQWRYDGLQSGPKLVAKQCTIVKQRVCVSIVHRLGRFTSRFLRNTGTHRSNHAASHSRNHRHWNLRPCVQQVSLEFYRHQ